MKKTKTIVSVVLLAFVAISLGWLFFQQSEGAKDDNGSSPSSMKGTTASAPEQTRNVKPDRIVVYYFHTSKRCPTCHKIENYTREVVEQKFAEDIKDGRLEFNVVNVEKPENKHFVKDYKLHTKSVVVSELKDGKEVRWKNLDKVWKLVGNKDKFFKYIEDEVNLYLKEK